MLEELRGNLDSLLVGPDYKDDVSVLADCYDAGYWVTSQRDVKIRYRILSART